MSTTQQYRVRLGGPGDIAEALPHLIGFPPRESVVLVSLTGPHRRRVGLTVRADLPSGDARNGPRPEPADLARDVVRSVLTDRPTAVVVAVVSEAADEPADRAAPPGTDGLPHRVLVGLLVEQLAAAGVPAPETILVRRGRWWSYDCPRSCCVPTQGTPLPGGTTTLAAASAAAGQVLAADRAELERRIAPVGFLAAAGMAGGCVQAGREQARRLQEVGWEAVADEAWQALQHAVDARTAGSGSAPTRPCSDAELARLAWALCDVQVRDRAMGLALDSPPAAVESLWVELTRRAPPPLDAAPATLLAVSAWLRGDGAMANVALDRALGSDPGYPLAQLMRTSLDAGMRPAAVRRLIAGARGDVDAAC